MRNSLSVKRFGSRVRLIAGLMFCFGLAGVSAAAATDPAVTGQPEVPLALSEPEKQSITRENNPKDRVEVCMRVCSARLTQVVEAVRHENYDGAAQMLNVYDSLLCYTNTFATKTEVKSKKRDHLYRIIETGLRRQTPFLEWVSREMPECHEHCAKTALNRAREIRRAALNSVFGGEFLKEETPALGAAVPRQNQEQ